MTEQRRILTAHADDLRQSLQAPVESVVAYADFLLELCGEQPELLADVQRIRQAAQDLSSTIAMLVDKSPDQLSMSAVRHDLRNSIGLVSGYAEILVEEYGELLDTKAGEYLALIQREARHFLQRLDALTELGSGDTAAVEKVFSSFRHDVRAGEGESLTGRILVIDDNPSSRELLSHQLQRQGHEVLEAASGADGLELIRSEAPDLVLLDLLMPDINGYEVLQQIRRDDALQQVPVVMISGIKDEEGAIRCIDAGASDYLTKPVNTTLLRARVSALLERKRWQDRERQYRDELEKSRDFIRKVFGRYLSDEVVDRLLDQRGGLTLGGERRDVTILMADIRGFSEISQRLSPEDCVKLLNNYLATMADVIISYRGTVDEFVGDAILAMFGAPVSNHDDAGRALACALAMQGAMGDINRYNRDNGLPEIEVGIGLNSGPVVVGNIGSERRSKYGIVGHHVNLTARVESCTVGGQVLASQYVLDSAGCEVETARCLEVDVKGAELPLKLYEVVGVGEPFNLRLQVEEEPLRQLSRALPVTLNTLRGKTLNINSGDAEVVAVAEHRLQLQTDLQLPMLSDVCVRLPGEQAGLLYAKVTAEPAAGNYELTLTSVSDALRDYLNSLWNEAGTAGEP